MFSNRYFFTPFLLTCLMLLAGTATPDYLQSQDLSFLGDDSQYLWPTDASPYLSSTFAETRSAHFHAGLDIRTWGREGYRVFATRDGILFRISIGPNGYGKVIYLQHDDGSFSVYAHLNRFAPDIQAYADSVRLQNFVFELDQQIDHLSHRVNQGDLIGFTGSTGVGPPHLHFELRSPENDPFNPLLTNLSVTDQIPPVFSRLAIEHLSTAGTPYGHTERIETRGRTLTNNVTDFGTIQTRGAVGLAVDVYDRANNTSNAYAVYTLTLIHEADTLFHSQVDQFSYNDASNMFIDRVFPLLAEEGRGYQRLFVVNGNDLSFYRKAENHGILDFPRGEYQLQIIAGDFYGNKSRATVTLSVDNRVDQPSILTRPTPAYSTGDGFNTDALSSWSMFRIEPRNLDPLYLTDLSSSRPDITSTRDDAPSRYLLFKGNNRQVLQKTVIPGRAQRLGLPDHSFWIDIPSDALFDTLQTQIALDLENSRPTIRFSPTPTPLKNSIYVNLIFPASMDLQTIDNGAGALGLYSYDEYRDRYSLLTPAINDRYFTTELSKLQTLVVMRDNAPPVTGRPFIRQSLGGNTLVILPARDQQSGIDYKKSVLLVNGQRGITEYDGEENELIFYLPGLSLEDQNRIRFRVTDRSGNVSEGVEFFNR